MPYSAGTPILGTREEIAQSLYNDCSAIATAAGFSQTVKIFIRQFEGFPAADSPGVIIDTGADDTRVPLLQDLYAKTVRHSIIGFVYDDTGTLATKVEAWMRDVERAILLNPYRSISGTPKAFTSTITNSATMYSGTLGRFLLTVESQYYDTR